MGCAASRIDREDRVRTCKDRKRLMKQLVGFRGEFADAHLVYLRAVKNTGVTLRQFTESESLELENTTYVLAVPPSPPPTLPPSPPPPPPFSPDLRKFDNDLKEQVFEQESIEFCEDDSCTPPPPPIPTSTWDFLDPFDSSSQPNKTEPIELAEEENWMEANTEFEKDDQEEEVVTNVVPNMLLVKSQPIELVDDDSSMISWHTKDTADMAVVTWRGNKTLAGIVKELDDYFLKASAGGNEIAVLMDFKRGDTLFPRNFEENKGNRCHSAKVFSALSWSWSSRSLQFARDIFESCDLSEPCRPGAHCITLEKLYAGEQKLYKEVKDEEISKLELERKSLLMEKQQQEDYDCAKTEKTRLQVETLQSDITCLQQSISRTSSSILKLIDEELQPQLVAITSGLMHMWRTMYECHQVQSHISRQINLLPNNPSSEPTTEYHRKAAAQLETEVTLWYNSFCKLMKSQRDYVTTFCKWVRLTNCLIDDHHQSHYSSVILAFCEEWQLALDKVPDKVVSEAIKCFCSAIHLVILQQAEEHTQHKIYTKLEKRLQKELHLLNEMEIKYAGNFAANDEHSLGAKHPLLAKRAKIETLRERVEGENAKYLNTVQVSRAMILNNLKTCLPTVFQALMGFSSSYSRTFEAILNRVKPTGACDDESNLF